MAWIGWPVSRVILLVISMVFFGIFVQVTMLHYRQNFRHWAQWIPVAALPVLATISLLITFYLTPTMIWATGILYGAGVGAGVGGLALHVTGVGERVGGYKLNNFLVGPPVVLPMMVTFISIIGLIALYWR